MHMDRRVEIKEILFGNFHLWFNDPHDIAAIIESYVLNVYKKQNIKNNVG